MIDSALAYAGRGWYIIPLHSIDADGNCTCGKTGCSSPAKHPVASLCPNGLKNASVNEAVLRSWFENQNRNIGIVTGKISGITILDCDNHKGGDVSLNNLVFDDNSNASVNTLYSLTGNGVHYFYKYTPLKNSVNKLGQGLDIRGDGGYIVAPPSIHANGRAYEFEHDLPLIDFPQEWIDILNAPKNRINSNGSNNGNGVHIPPVKNYQVPDSIHDGGRNDALASMAGKMHFDGFSLSSIETVLLIENKRLCSPPLSDDEVRKIARSINRNYSPGVVYTQPIQDDHIENWDDVTIAKLFVRDNQEFLRFNPEAKKWFAWTGSHWELDKGDLTIKKAAEFSQDLYRRVPNMVNTSAQMKDANRQVARSNSNAGLKAFFDLSKSYLSVSQSNFDQNHYLLNVKNGTIDLKTGNLLPHNPNDFITRVCSFDYDKYAKIQAYKGFLESIQPELEVRNFIRRSLGYSLLGIARERAFWILYGNGNNGKSVFIDLFSEILNDYASEISSATVMRKPGPDSIPNDIARQKGKRFVVIPETDENEALNASLIKAMSSGDKITARFLFGEYFDFYFSGKIWIATNHKPRITDHSKGFWDRLKIIPFTVDIPKQNVIKRDTLLSSLLDEAPAILNWMVQGCLEYLNNSDLKTPPIVQDEIDLYKYEQDSIAQFIDECCEIDASYQTANGDLYKKYVEFCKEAGEYQRSQRRFTQNLKERGFEQTRNFGQRVWQGISIK